MNHDPYDPRAQHKAKQESERQRQADAQLEQADMKWLMSNAQGRRVVWRLLERAGVFRLSFNTNSMQMAFNEGHRYYGMHTLRLIHGHCPELYQTMIHENTTHDHDRTGRHQHNDP